MFLSYKVKVLEIVFKNVLNIPKQLRIHEDKIVLID